MIKQQNKKLNAAAADLQQLYNELPVDEEATRSQQEQPLAFAMLLYTMKTTVLT